MIMDGYAWEGANNYVSSLVVILIPRSVYTLLGNVTENELYLCIKNNNVIKLLYVLCSKVLKIILQHCISSTDDFFYCFTNKWGFM